MTTIRAEIDRRRIVGIAAVGELQCDVTFPLLRTEFGAEPQFEPARYTLARRNDTSCGQALAGRRGVEIATRTYGTLIAPFTSQSWPDAASRDLPETTLNPIIDL